MKKITSAHGFIVALAIFFLGGVAFPHMAAAETVHGVMVVVKGTIRIKSADGAKERRARINMKVFAKETIITESDGRAKIVMIDKNVLNISPNSELKIAAYNYNADQDRKQVVLDIVKGKVRADVQQKYEGKNSFRVRTPTAVAGVRGTDFMTSFDTKTQTSEIVTFKGLVEFGKRGPAGTIVNPVKVAPGQMTRTLGKNPPLPPFEVPKNQLNQMNSESDPEAPRSTDKGAEADQGKDSGTKADEGQGADGEKRDPGAGDGDKSSNTERGDKEGSSGDKKQSQESNGEKRNPASRGGDKPGDSMLDDNDLGKGSEHDSKRGGKDIKNLPPPPVPPSGGRPNTPGCDSCRDYTNVGGRSKVIITVEPPNNGTRSQNR